MASLWRSNPQLNYAIMMTHTSLSESHICRHLLKMTLSRRIGEGKDLRLHRVAKNESVAHLWCAAC